MERTSRFLILVPLTGRDSLSVTDAVIAATDGLPASIRRSLTWDCGTEMARHAAITATGLPVFFAHPHSPWERGSNENLNRIVREFCSTFCSSNGRHSSSKLSTRPVAARSPAPARRIQFSRTLFHAQLLG